MESAWDIFTEILDIVKQTKKGEAFQPFNRRIHLSAW